MNLKCQVFTYSFVKGFLGGELEIRIAPLGWDQGLVRTSICQESISQVLVFSPNNTNQVSDSIIKERLIFYIFKRLAEEIERKVFKFF